MWKAPVDAIGRGDSTLVIDERPQPAIKEIEAEPKALPAAERHETEPEVPEAEEDKAEASPPPEPPRPAKKEAPVQSEERPRPRLFVPDRPPDDPGVTQSDADESPNSLERLRTAQIR